MPAFYKILKADPLGDPWTPSQPGATAIQNFWCQVEGQANPVSIGKQVGNTLTAGQHVYGDLLYAKSQKGTEYWKFKSQQVPEGVDRPADTPAQAQAQAATQPATPASNVSAQMPGWFMPVANQIDYIWREMRKMDADAPQAPLPPVLEPEPKVEQVGGEPIDEETQATLDAIFSPEPEPEV